MIQIEPDEKSRYCNVCRSVTPAYNITFLCEEASSWKQISLCAKCLENLVTELGGKPLPRMKGRWTDETTLKPFGDDTVQCTECGFYTDRDTNYKFCPNCGAQMEPGSTSEE